MKTIVALSTFPANSAIHIIRVSGGEAYKIVGSICQKKIIKKGYAVEMNQIVDKQKLIDNILLIKFVKPHSFTGEDVIEINCHGGLYLAKKIIKLLLSKGGVYAKNGEFSQRAFLNNKINLIQAQGINNLINSNSDIGIDIANNGISKENKKELLSIKEKLFKLIGQAETNIDYPEYDDVPNVTSKDARIILEEIIGKLQKVSTDSKSFLPMMEGVKIAIVGKPNVGKSSLLNAFLEEEKALVSSIPGTTRDIVEGNICINGLGVKFLDTAGIRNSKHLIEKKGIKLSEKAIKDADIVIFVYDCSKKVDENDKAVLSLLTKKQIIYVANKTDLKTKQYFLPNSIKISAKNKSIADLKKQISKKFISDVKINDKNLILQSENEIQIVDNIVLLLKKCLVDIKNKKTFDFIMQNLHMANEKIETLVGNIKEYNYLNEFFKKFCIGK